MDNIKVRLLTCKSHPSKKESLLYKIYFGYLFKIQFLALINESQPYEIIVNETRMEWKGKLRETRKNIREERKYLFLAIIRTYTRKTGAYINNFRLLNCIYLSNFFLLIDQLLIFFILRNDIITVGSKKKKGDRAILFIICPFKVNFCNLKSSDWYLCRWLILQIIRSSIEKESLLYNILVIYLKFIFWHW